MAARAWHVNGYVQACRFGTPATPLATLERAWVIRKEAGLRFVYLSNVRPRICQHRVATVWYSTHQTCGEDSGPEPAAGWRFPHGSLGDQPSDQVDAG